MGERRNIGPEGFAHFEMRQQIFADIQYGMGVFEYHEAHNGSAGADQLTAFGINRGDLARFRGYQPCILQQGAHLSHYTAGRIDQRPGAFTILFLRSVERHLVLFVGGPFSGLCRFIKRLHFIFALRRDDAVPVKGRNPVVGHFGQA